MNAPRRRLAWAAAAVLVCLAGSGWVATADTSDASAPNAGGGIADTLAARRCAYEADMVSQRTCYETHFGEIGKRDGFVAAVAQATAFHADPEAGPFPMFCHEVLHRLGTDAVATAADRGGDPVEVLANLSVSCTGGFAHGALSAYFDQLDVDVIDTMATLCPELVARVDQTRPRPEGTVDETGNDGAAGRDDSWLRWNCDHMLGHAVFRAVSDRNAADSLAAGSALCEQVSDGPMRRGCAAGYFMEHYLDVARDPESRAAKETPGGIDGVFTLCRQATGTIARGCYGESGGLVYQRAGFDWQASAEACAASGAASDNILACYESLGANVAAYSGYDDTLMRDACGQLDSVTAADACFIQIAGASAMELADADAGRSICNDEVSAARRDDCINSVSGTEESLRASGFGGGVAADW